MSSQLQQILKYLDQDNVTEVVLGVGRKIAIRQDGGYASLTPKPITLDQLMNLVRGTPLSGRIPDGDAARPAVDLELFGRRVRAQVSRKADEIMIRIERAPVPKASEVVLELDDMELELEPMDTPARPARAARTTTQPRTRPATAAPRPRSASVAVRTKAASVAPRTRGTSVAPRTRAASVAPRTRAASVAARSKAASVAPRTKASSLAPRAKASSVAPRTKAVSVAPRTKATSVAPRTRAASAALRAHPATPLPSRMPTSATFANLVRAARDRGASDLHISAGRPISVRTIGSLEPLDPAGSPVSVAETESLLLPLLEPAHQALLARSGYVDLAVDLTGAGPGGGRLRANISRHQSGLKGTFRLAIAEPKTLDELGLPKDLAKVIAHHQGFIVIAGPSGQGKTTTLAALIDIINSTKPYHILTIEDPIEIVHPRKVAVVSQREAGRHTKSFVSALKASLREDPDVIVIGELRDRESVEIALTAAETGHLVISTMSTPNAAKTLDRLIDMFPPADHSQVRASIAGALRAIVAQRLLPSADGTGVVPAVELLTGVLPLAALIRDDKLYQLPNLMQRGRAFGMMRFDDSLLELVRAGKITEETALAATDNKKEMLATLRPPPAAAPPLSAGARLGQMFGKKDR